MEDYTLGMQFSPREETVNFLKLMARLMQCSGTVAQA